MSYEVFALKYGQVDVPPHYATILEDPNDPHTAGRQLFYYVWLVRGQGRNILVDCGFDHACGAKRGRKVDRLPDEAIARIKEAIEKTYGRRGAAVVERNRAAVDHALEGLHRIEVPNGVTATRELPPPVPIPSAEVAVHWHERFDADSGNRWLREQLIALFAA